MIQLSKRNLECDLVSLKNYLFGHIFFFCKKQNTSKLVDIISSTLINRKFHESIGKTHTTDAASALFLNIGAAGVPIAINKWLK